MSNRLLDILLSSFTKLLIPFLKVTVPLTVIVFAVSLVLAFLLAIVQVLDIRFLKQFARAYIWFFRGTPLLVQLYLIFYGLPYFGIILPAFPSAVIGFSLNLAAYNAETMRSAIQSVSVGQTEAGYMVGLSYGQIMRRLVLPQAARVAFPNLFNSLISLTKDTSLASSVTVVEMIRTAQQIGSRYAEPFALYCEAAVIYLAVCSLLTLIQSRFEKRLQWKTDTGTSDKTELADGVSG